MPHKTRKKLQYKNIFISQVAAVIIAVLLLIDDDIIKQFFNDSSQ